MTEEKKVGRPSSYRPEYCEQIKEFMKDGSAIVEFSAHIGVSRDTLHEWCKVHPEFSDAFKIAKENCEAWWTKTGRTGLFMGGKDNPFQSSLYNFTMAARFGWSQKTEVESTNTNIEIKIDESDSEL